jgi:hypothetical protein
MQVFCHWTIKANAGEQVV